MLLKTVAGNRTKMVAALQGHSELAVVQTVVPVPARATQRSRLRTMPAEPRWRAAA
jgi:hypothetical protein